MVLAHNLSSCLASQHDSLHILKTRLNPGVKVARNDYSAFSAGMSDLRQKTKDNLLSSFVMEVRLMIYGEEPERPEQPKKALAGKVHGGVRTYRAIQRMFLLDIMQDQDSRPAMIWAGSTLLIGVIAYHFLEGWSVLDSLYFCVITLATVGYGDITPATPVGRLFTVIYVINGIGILLALFDRIRAVRSARIQERRQGKNDSGES
jgi:voltage-gated potassium channel